MGNKKRGLMQREQSSLGSRKHKVFLLVFVVFLLFLTSLVRAEEGCYFYKESMLYCFDLERADALEDCLAYDDCKLEDVFVGGKSCEDTASFPECEEIFCKSSCDYEFSGKCLGGAVPEGEEYTWCSAGCCRFEYYGGESCGFRESKWLCEREAKNKEAKEFNFDSAINKEECENICSRAAISGEKTTEGLVMERVSEEETVPEVKVTENKENISGEAVSPKEEETALPSLSEQGLTKGEEKEITQEEAEKSKAMIWVWFFLILFLLLIIFYLSYQKYKLKEKKTAEPKIKKAKKPRFFLRKKAIKEREERLKKLQEAMEEKRKEEKREELFGLFGFAEPKERKLSYVDLLGKVAKAHELRKKRQLKEKKEEEDIFKEIEGLVKKVKEEEGEVGKEKRKKSREEEAKEIFERLKKIIQKQE